ncbi:MAG: hypothetical protein H8F28_10910 [Fibrella sp.]|nr:hypothetical protein [Armatimonadota bacterium]
MLSRRVLLGTSLPALAFGFLPVRSWAVQSGTPSVRLTFNMDGVRRLLDLRRTKDVSETAINALLDLPAYKNVLRVGEAEGSVTRERLAANARAVIQGTATPRNQPREDAARLVIPSEEICRDLLKQLDDSAQTRTARIAEHLSSFTPDKVKKGDPITQTVYLHLGGTWDALNTNGDIFLNFHYWLEYNSPSLDGLNLVVAHETMHTVQNRAYGNPEAQETSVGAFFTALSKIQREGTARLIETDIDLASYGQYTYGFFYRAVDNESLRDFARLPRLLEPLHAACFPAFDKERFVALYATGMNNGGPFYALGHGVAKAIDERAGRPALLATIEGGPKVFWSRYIELCRSVLSLPRLPASVETRIKELPDRLTTET